MDVAAGLGRSESRRYVMSYDRCGHDPCQCNVEGKEYCSEYCEQRSAPGLSTQEPYECRCGHPACMSEAE